MKLNILERLKLVQMLPEEGNFLMLNIIQKLKESLSPTEAEFKEFEIVETAGSLHWNEKGREAKEIAIGEKATEVLVGAITKLDEENKLTEQHLSLYKKFIGE